MTRRKQLIALATVAAVLVLAVAIDGWLVWRHAGQTIAHIAEKKEEEVDLTSLVMRVRDLSRLETASMHVVHVGTLTQSYEMVPNALAGDEITFFATGDVIAGVDLSQLKQQDVRREPDGTITLRLPPSQILVTRLDNRESRVITRNTGVFRRRRIAQHRSCMLAALVTSSLFLVCYIVYHAHVGSVPCMLAMGLSKPWQDALSEIAGQREMDAKDIQMKEKLKLQEEAFKDQIEKLKRSNEIALKKS